MIFDPKSPAAKSPVEGPALNWAAEQLGVPAESPPEVCTAAFLRRLADEDFMPPQRLRQAWEIATGKSCEESRSLPWIDAAVEEELSNKIEDFAQLLYYVPLEQRSAHWERLYADARRWPRLEARLQQLKLGLADDFAPQPPLSPLETRLIQWIRELSTLPLEERAQLTAAADSARRFPGQRSSALAESCPAVAKETLHFHCRTCRSRFALAVGQLGVRKRPKQLHRTGPAQVRSVRSLRQIRSVLPKAAEVGGISFRWRSYSSKQPGEGFFVTPNEPPRNNYNYYSPPGHRRNRI